MIAQTCWLKEGIGQIHNKRTGTVYFCAGPFLRLFGFRSIRRLCNRTFRVRVFSRPGKGRKVIWLYRTGRSRTSIYYSPKKPRKRYGIEWFADYLQKGGSAYVTRLLGAKVLPYQTSIRLWVSLEFEKGAVRARP